MQIDYKVGPPVTNEELNALYADAWPGPCEERDFTAVLERSLVHVCAYRGNELVGFVYVAWDGGVHAFLLEPTVRSDLPPSRDRDEPGPTCRRGSPRGRLEMAARRLRGAAHRILPTLRIPADCGGPDQSEGK